MEVADPASRQRFDSTIHTDDRTGIDLGLGVHSQSTLTTTGSLPPHRPPQDHRTQPSNAAMATATILKSASHYQTHSSFPPSYAYASSSPSMASHSEERRLVEQAETPRRALPSISEMLNSRPTAFTSGPSPPPPPPSAAVARSPPPNSAPVMAPPSATSSIAGNVPPPFTPTAQPRQHVDVPPKHSLSPRSNSPRSPDRSRRHEPPAGYVEQARPPLTSRHTGPPAVAGFPGPQHLPPGSSRLETPVDEFRRSAAAPAPRLKEAQDLYYAAPGSSHLPPRGYGPPPGHHHAPSQASSYDGSRPMSFAEEAEYDKASIKHQQHLSKFYEDWGYTDNLNKLSLASRTLYNFAEAYTGLAAEEGGPPQHQLKRFPSQRELTDMANTADYVKQLVDTVRIHTQRAQTVQAQEMSRRKATYDEDDLGPYNETMKPPYETKRKRGRAAPPGRCHSCNRIDTPEWRRGPDGARTLCNACGLHFAKLERKKQVDVKNARPRHSDERQQ